MIRVPSRKNTAATRRLLAMLALLLVVSAAQFAAVFHAEAHVFHESDELCVAFQHVDKQPLLPGAAAARSDVVKHEPAPHAPVPQWIQAESSANCARAPPVS